MSIALEHVNYIYSPGTAMRNVRSMTLVWRSGRGSLSGSSVIPDQENLR